MGTYLYRLRHFTLSFVPPLSLTSAHSLTQSTQHIVSCNADEDKTEVAAEEDSEADPVEVLPVAALAVEVALVQAMGAVVVPRAAVVVIAAAMVEDSGAATVEDIVADPAREEAATEGVSAGVGEGAESPQGTPQSLRSAIRRC